MARIPEHRTSQSVRGTRRGARVQGTFIDAVTLENALERILQWARRAESRCVCTCNVHMIVTASRDAGLSAALERADLVTPDGMPVAVALRVEGFRAQSRVSGPDLAWAVCERAAAEKVPIYLYGATEATLERLKSNLKRALPALVIVGSWAPPFRPLSYQEDQIAVDRIRASGARLVLVGLGCPKQELWMEAHRGRIPAVMIGVGAAFDFHAGAVRRAPAWMQRSGLEWLHRLLSEPHRLWRRYLVTNSLFLLAMARRALFRRAA
jgi:N-acetylglucosaminyldiphosphoundecaprenol N-acetyl-beta-D-mannosaminyltransferase